MFLTSLNSRTIWSRASLRKFLSPIFFSFTGAFIALFPSNPYNATLPSRDSGVFLYVGWRLVNGDTPYRDVWDHKPPFIYFIDALGMLLTPQSLLGVWLIQFLFIFLTLFFLYKALDDALGILPAIAVTVILTSGLLTILEQGNVTEEYALVFQALSFWLFTKAYKNDYPLVNTFWIGLGGGFAFYFKQTTISVWVAYALILLTARVAQKKIPIKDFAILLAGPLLLTAVFVVYFASQNALGDFWEQAFLYNFVYIGKHEGYRRLIPVFVKGFLFLSRGGILYIAISGWLASAAYAWFHQRVSHENISPLILLAIINFPIEVILITISGRSILHYYLTPLPVMAILSGILIYVIPLFSAKISSPIFLKVQSGMSAALLIGILVLQTNQIQDYPVYMQAVAQNDSAPVIQYVTSYTKPDDRVLIIGAESVINFLARREAPTRYVYQYPLQLLGRRDMFEEYFRQILQNKPALIIFAPGSGQLDENLYKPLQKRSPAVFDSVRYLIQNYEQMAQFGDWVVYRLKENP